MNYTELYLEYFDKLVKLHEERKPSVMIPPGNPSGIDEQEVLKQLPPDTATVIFTTGTTGEPKGVIHTFETTENSVESNIKLLGVTENDLHINFIPTWTIGPYLYTVPTLLKGGKILHDKFDPARFQSLLDHNPTTMILIPTMLDMIKESGIKFDLTGVRNVGVGAEGVEKRHLEYVLELGAESVTHIYGSSEAIPVCLYNTFYSKDEINLGLKEVPGFSYRNEDSLLISGDIVSKSYLHKEIGEWYNSNDNFILKDGLYYWQKRTDNIVKKKGWKVVVD